MREYLRSRHICLITEDLDKAMRDIPAIFGVELAFEDPEVEVFDIRNALYTFGLSLIEIAMPTSGTAATRRFLDKSGGRGGYVIAFNCSDPIARGERANRLGVRTIADLDYNHAGFRAIQLHPKDCGGVMLEFDHTEGGEPLLGPLYAAGTDRWYPSVNTSRTLGITSVTTECDDPAQTARLWSDMLGLPVEEGAAGPEIPMDLFSLRFRQVPEGAKPAFTEIAIRVKDPLPVLAEARARGYVTDGNAIAMCGVTFTLEDAGGGHGHHH